MGTPLRSMATVSSYTAARCKPRPLVSAAMCVWVCQMARPSSLAARKVRDVEQASTMELCSVLGAACDTCTWTCTRLQSYYLLTYLRLPGGEYGLVHDDVNEHGRSRDLGAQSSYKVDSADVRPSDPGQRVLRWGGTRFGRSQSM